jgi:predicted HTH transcriptional regulator
MNDDLHLPWDRDSLEALLRKVVSTGETTKVDLKGILDLSTVQQQAELLKDVAAFANTYSHHYRNHGFIILGATQGQLSYSAFGNDEDHLQATIDDLVNKYLRPFITTHLFIFGEGEKQWGAIVVPPTRNAPHVFYNEIHKRYRGDVYVRNGTTTEKAQSEDYARFFRQHLEEHTYEFQQSINDLQRQVLSLRAQLKKIQSTPASRKGRRSTAADHAAESSSSQQQPKQYHSITDRIDELFAKEEDEIIKGLQAATFAERYQIPPG